MSINDEPNKVLDSIIEHRRTVRGFKPETPRKELIEAVIHAGLWAPYAGLAVGDGRDFRKFFVIEKDKPILGTVVELIQRQSKVSLELMEKQFSEKPFLREKSKGLLGRLTSMAEKGFPDLLNAPCLIVVAERRGMPPAERQSLAHVVQNMWLKATALGLGLRLISVIETLSENEDFSKLLGLKMGEFAFTGCIVGFSAEEPMIGKRPNDKEVIRWL